LIQDHAQWAKIRLRGLRRFVVPRTAAVCLFVVVGYLALHVGSSGSQLELSGAFAALVGGLLAGLVYALLEWRMRDRAFRREP